jgi:hypothetical protein
VSDELRVYADASAGNAIAMTTTTTTTTTRAMMR